MCHCSLENCVLKSSSEFKHVHMCKSKDEELGHAAMLPARLAAPPQFSALQPSNQRAPLPLRPLRDRLSTPLRLPLWHGRSELMCLVQYGARQRGSSTPSDVTSPMASHWRRAYLCGGWAQIKCTIWLSPLQTARINKPALQLSKAPTSADRPLGGTDSARSLNSGVSTFIYRIYTLFFFTVTVFLRVLYSLEESPKRIVNFSYLKIWWICAFRAF